jgi:hypothetical protein
MAAKGTRPLFLLILSGLFVLVWSCGPPKIIQKPIRTELEPETIGPLVYDIRARDKWDEMDGRMRQFLWDHITQKRMGRVKYVSFSLEGEPGECSYSVEPEGDADHWGIVQNCDETLRSYSGKKPTHRKYSHRYCEPIRIDASTLQVIPGTATPPPDQYRLRVTNCENKEEQVL